MRFMLIHGNPSHIGDWANTIPALRSLGEVVAFDQVGFGRSPRLVGAEPSLTICADVAVALADELGWESFVVIGQSHGGLVAHTIGAHYPRRARAVVLLCTAGTPAHASYRILARPWVRRVLPRVAGPLLRLPVARPLAQLITSLAVRQVCAPDPAPPGAAAQQLALFAANPHALDSIAAVVHDNPCAVVARHAQSITAPVLFVHGEQDRLVPIAYARRLYEATKTPGGATFVAVPGGHMVHYCRPHLVNEVVLEWLRKLAPEPSEFTLR